MKKFILIGFLLYLIPVKSQVFTYTASPTVTTDIPGGTMYYHIGFYNPTASSITVAFDRYAKFNPPYWYSCFCFIQCNPPALDYVNINIPPNSWGPQMSILFKTDSVNPGQATASIRFYQIGFQNNADTVHLTAITSLATGITHNTSVSSSLAYPNPTKEEFTFVASQIGTYEILLMDINGKVVLNNKNLTERKTVLKLEVLPAGEYFLKAIYGSGQTETKKIIKN